MLSTFARKLLKRLGVLGGALVFFLLVAELVLRLFVPLPEVFEPYRVEAWYEGRWVALPPGGHAALIAPASDPQLADLRGEFRPRTRFRLCYDARGRWRRPYFDENGCVEIEINSAGQRGPLRSPPRPQGTYRVAVVGDSFTFGHGLSFEATWPAVLERGLNAALGGARGDEPRVAGQEHVRAEVLNFAVSGYDVLDVALVTRHKALRWEPQRLLYGFFLNDLFVGDDGDLGEDEAWRGVDESELHDRLFGKPHGLAAVSRLYFLIERALAARYVADLTRDAYLQAGTPGSGHFEAWRAGLEDMAAACRSAGVPLDVVIFPELAQLDGGHPYLPVYAAVRAAAQELGLGVVDIFEVWRDQDPSQLWVHPTDHHPNEVAAREAGRAVLEYLEGADPLLR